MRDLPYPRPIWAAPANQLLEQSRRLLEHSRALREDSLRLRARFRAVCERASRAARRPTPKP
jgi:hypothetical protein